MLRVRALGLRLETLAALSRDGHLLLATRGIRMFGQGFIGIVLALYLAELGLSAAGTGLVFTVSLACGAVLTVAFSSVADRVGRRRMLLLSSAFMAASGALLSLSGELVIILAAAALGTFSPNAGEVGPSLPLEQASLPQTTAEERRTAAFAWYNLVGSGAVALGALAAGLPSLLVALVGMAPVAAYRALLLAYMVCGVLLIALFGQLSPAIEAARVESRPGPTWLGLHRSRRVVLGLTGLFALDSFASGFAPTALIALWMNQRFGAEPAVLGSIFFGFYTLAALSTLVASRLAARFGLVNTMVFTHLPASALLAVLGFVPSLELAVAIVLIRGALAQMDVPARQSYTMALVAPDERAAAAGLTNVARNAANALSPALAGSALASPSLAVVPFVLAGGLKTVYDLSLLALFRHRRPPEEQNRPAEP